MAWQNHSPVDIGLYYSVSPYCLFRPQYHHAAYLFLCLSSASSSSEQL